MRKAGYRTTEHCPTPPSRVGTSPDVLSLSQKGTSRVGVLLGAAAIMSLIVAAVVVTTVNPLSFTSIAGTPAAMLAGETVDPGMVPAFPAATNLPMSSFGGVVATASEELPPFATEVPQSVQQLQDLEERVKLMVDKVLPATVALRIDRRGTQGSGVVVDAEGLILTAGHVISYPGRSCTVTFPDGRRVAAETLGSHSSDAGMVRITEPGDYPFVEIADRRLEDGEWCIGLGHPGGLESGREPVVRLGRVLKGNSRGFVRTDSQIIRGDSGGPLFDLDGRLIGIHSRLEARFTANYHVPMAAFRDRWDELVDAEFSVSERRQTSGFDRSRETLPKPYLGIGRAPDNNGCVVNTVTEGSAAANAGVQIGDVIVRIDGKVVRSWNDLLGELDDKKVGDAVKLEIRRDGTRRVLDATLGRRPDE